jgi:hypothetical protein
MHIINRSRIHEATVTAVALRSHVADNEFLLFLDDAVNTARADLASAKLEEYRQKGWKFTQPSWEKEATGEKDQPRNSPSRSLPPSAATTSWSISTPRGREQMRSILS